MKEVFEHKPLYWPKSLSTFKASPAAYRYQIANSSCVKHLKRGKERWPLQDVVGAITEIGAQSGQSRYDRQATASRPSTDRPLLAGKRVLEQRTVERQGRAQLPGFDLDLRPRGRGGSVRKVMNRYKDPQRTPEERCRSRTRQRKKDRRMPNF